MNGGDIIMNSGSGDASSGRIAIQSNAVGSKQSTSGSVSLSSGSATAVEASSGTVVISSGQTKDTTPGAVTLLGGTSEQGHGGGVNIIGGGSLDAGIGGGVSLRKSTIAFKISLFSTQLVLFTVPRTRDVSFCSIASNPCMKPSSVTSREWREQPCNNQDVSFKIWQEWTNPHSHRHF